MKFLIFFVVNASKMVWIYYSFVPDIFFFTSLYFLYFYLLSSIPYLLCYHLLCSVFSLLYFRLDFLLCILSLFFFIFVCISLLSSLFHFQSYFFYSRFYFWYSVCYSIYHFLLVQVPHQLIFYRNFAVLKFFNYYRKIFYLFS